MRVITLWLNAKKSVMRQVQVHVYVRELRKAKEYPSGDEDPPYMYVSSGHTLGYLEATVQHRK